MRRAMGRRLPLTTVTSSQTGADVRAGTELAGYTTLRLGGPAARFVTGQVIRCNGGAVR